VKIKIKKLRPDVEIPSYAHGPKEDAGMDLRAAEPFTVFPNSPVVVSTGLSIELQPGYEAQIRPRSGLAAKHGITVVNSPGTIDPSYRGEIKVILMTSKPEAVSFGAGERIAQMVVSKYEPVEFVEVQDLGDSSRGTGGFGSTGTK
jgi:dUTP pyrophosphatase